MDVFSIIGRSETLFKQDLHTYDREINDAIKNSTVLIVGAAGSIGRAITLEILKKCPKRLHAVDISENSLVELVRGLRSSIGYVDTEFRTFALDCGGPEFTALCSSGVRYDYIFNLSAMKHVRSERDPYTLYRLIRTNIFNSVTLAKTAKQHEAKNYFCVSTDKAANPVNMMGASKRIMELFLAREGSQQSISMARFANVAFSDGSLLDGFKKRIEQKQPITAPLDIRRYFVTPSEAGELCLLSGFLGKNQEIFFPKLSSDLNLELFSNIAIRFVENLGYSPHICTSEEEARNESDALISNKKWPLYFFNSDTTGEKEFEEFYTAAEEIDLSRFDGVGVVKPNFTKISDGLDDFICEVNNFSELKIWDKERLVEVFSKLLPEFKHVEKGKNLDDRM